jgi:hypothetical protein
MTKNKSNRSITRSNLGNHGIYYDDEGLFILPAHVQVVRDILLSFEGVIPDGGWEETSVKEESKYSLEDVAKEA